MNDGANVFRAEGVIFPMKPHEEVTEDKSIKNEENDVSDDRNVKKKNRFARLSRSMRKRAKSIF